MKNRERGSTMIEYALLVALIAVVTTAAAQEFGTRVKCKFNNSAKIIAGDTGDGNCEVADILGPP